MKKKNSNTFNYQEEQIMTLVIKNIDTVALTLVLLGLQITTFIL